MTTSRVPRGQQTLPPPPPPPLTPRPLLPAHEWRAAIGQAPDLTRDVKIVAARLTDYCHDDGARIVPAPQLGALAHAAELTRGAVTGCLAALQTAGWLAATAGPDQHGRPLLRLCDPRGKR